MKDPRAITPGSIMPGYPWMLEAKLDFDTIPATMRSHRALGVPYTDQDIDSSIEHAADQARQIATEVAEQGGPEGLEDTQVVALIAYLQRLGTDITRPEPAQTEPPASEAPTAEPDSAKVAEAR